MATSMNYILTTSGHLYRASSQQGLNESGLLDASISMELIDKNVTAINTRGPVLAFVAHGGVVATVGGGGCSINRTGATALGRFNCQDGLGRALNGVRVNHGEGVRLLCDANYCLVIESSATSSQGIRAHYWGHGLAPLGVARAELPRTVALTDLFPHLGGGRIVGADANDGAIAALDGDGTITFCNLNVAPAQCRTRVANVLKGRYAATALTVNSREMLYMADEEGHVHLCDFSGAFLTAGGATWPASCSDMHEKHRATFLGTTINMLFAHRR
jgi:hypothetical protein